MSAPGTEAPPRWWTSEECRGEFDLYGHEDCPDHEACACPCHGEG